MLSVFRLVLSSSSVLAPPSDSALKGSANGSSSAILKELILGGGEVRIRDGGKKSLGMPCSSSDVAECGDMIRTVLPVLVLVVRGIS